MTHRARASHVEALEKENERLRIELAERNEECEELRQAAQRQGGEAVGEIDHESSTHTAWFDDIREYPQGTKLYTAPQPAVPEPDWIACTADTERLDWLDQRREDCVQEGPDGEPKLYAHAWGIYEQAGSIREAIDMNMKRPEPPEDET